MAGIPGQMSKNTGTDESGGDLCIDTSSQEMMNGTESQGTFVNAINQATNKLGSYQGIATEEMNTKLSMQNFMLHTQSSAGTVEDATPVAGNNRMTIRPRRNNFVEH